MQIAEIVMIESYSETLRRHPKNEVLIYPLNKPLSYNGFHNAKTRLKKEGKEYTFEIILNNGGHFLQVKRIK